MKNTKKKKIQNRKLLGDIDCVLEDLKLLGKYDLIADKFCLKLLIETTQEIKEEILKISA